MLPLELGNPGLFGDDLQLVSSCVAFILESAGVAVGIAQVSAGRTGGVRAARRPRRIARHGRSCSWSGGRIPPDEPENTKNIVRDEKGFKRGLCRSRRSPPPTSAGTAPFGLVVGRTHVAAVFHGVLGSTSTRERELGLAKAWKAEELVKG
jgi:hypothetical protein